MNRLRINAGAKVFDQLLDEGIAINRLFRATLLFGALLRGQVRRGRARCRADFHTETMRSSEVRRERIAQAFDGAAIGERLEWNPQPEMVAIVRDQFAARGEFARKAADA